MSTIQTTLRITPRRWSATLFTTIGTLVAIGVTVLFLTLTGPSHRNPATASHPAQTYGPLIHYRGTGAPPATNPHTDHAPGVAVIDPETGQPARRRRPVSSRHRRRPDKDRGVPALAQVLRRGAVGPGGSGGARPQGPSRDPDAIARAIADGNGEAGPAWQRGISRRGGPPGPTARCRPARQLL